jgi:hypothetical protein
MADLISRLLYKHNRSNVKQFIPETLSEYWGLNGWHQFRHIHISQLHNLGVSVKIAQQQLGVPLSVRAHRKEICDLERLWFPTVSKLEQTQNSGGYVKLKALKILSGGAERIRTAA